jgi:hypothetical protein
MSSPSPQCTAKNATVDHQDLTWIDSQFHAHSSMVKRIRATGKPRVLLNPLPVCPDFFLEYATKIVESTRPKKRQQVCVSESAIAYRLANGLVPQLNRR